MGAVLGTCLGHLEQEKPWQVASYKKIGTKSQESSETATQPPQTAPHIALQSHPFGNIFWLCKAVGCSLPASSSSFSFQDTATNTLIPQ